MTKTIDIDKIAMGSIVRIGGELYQKVSPMIAVSVETGELLYDARIWWPDAAPPMVEFVRSGRRADTPHGDENG